MGVDFMLSFFVLLLFLEKNVDCFRTVSNILPKPSLYRKLRSSTEIHSPITSSSIQELTPVINQHESKQQKIAAIAREDFPILNQEVYPNKKLVYLDSGASSQKPWQVLKKMDDYYHFSHSNVHRGAHALAMKATELYEKSRENIQHFIGAKQREEIIFTRGATEAINLVALTWGMQNLKPGDEIILSVMEHHSNLVPWQMLAQRTGCTLQFVQLTPNMTFDLQDFQAKLNPSTKLIAVSYASNVLGTINPVEEIITLAHHYGAKVLLDACQAVPHLPVNVTALDVDFLVASSHKMCGPTGVGFLYGKYSLLVDMPPLFGGGEMIDRVELQSSTYALPPSRFEAGTPPIAECVGLGEACEYLTKIGMDKIQQHEQELGAYLYQELSKIPDIDIYGPCPTEERPRTGLIAFNSKKVHASDLSFFLDQEGIAVRTGHHCTQPLHRILGAAGSCRVSLYFYNNQEDVDYFIEKLKDVIAMFDNLSTL